MNHLGIILLLTITGSFALSTTSNCIGKNPYISLLKEYQVQIYEKPQTNSAHCGQEWKTHGTCCEPKSLADYSKNMLQNIINVIDWVGSTTQRLLSEADKICKPIVFMQTFKEGGCLAMNNGPIKSIYQAVTKIGSHFSSQNSKCLMRFKEMRSNALCSVCSGKSQEYFSGVKIKFWNTDCLKVVDDCKSLWDALVRGLQVIQNMRGNIGNPAIENLLSLFVDNNHVKEFVDYYSGAQVIYHLNRCPSSSNCPIDSQVAICNSLVSLINPSIYQALRQLLRNGPQQNNYAIVDSSSSPAQSTTAKTPIPAPAPVASPPSPAQSVGNLVGNLFGGGLPKFGNWRRRLFQNNDPFSSPPHSFDTPAGGRFEPLPVSGRSMTDVTTVCSFAAQGCQKSSIAMDLTLKFP